MLRANGLTGAVYAEPYCGGAGAALWLLANRHVSRIEINDIDPAVAAFWRCAVHRSCEMVRIIDRTRVTIDEWHRQREILARGADCPDLELGFAALFLNRTNHSGIIRGGPIGGQAQAGGLRLDIRFDKREIIQRVEQLGRMSDRIRVHQFDALDFVSMAIPSMGPYSLTYLDPPYYHRAGGLYRHRYGPVDHAEIAERIRTIRHPWIVTYDRCPEIRKLYAGIDSLDYSLSSHAGAGCGTSCETAIYRHMVLAGRPPVDGRAVRH